MEEVRAEVAARGMVGVSSAEDSAAVPREGVTEAGVETAVVSMTMVGTAVVSAVRSSRC